MTLLGMLTYSRRASAPSALGFWFHPYGPLFCRILVICRAQRSQRLAFLRR